MKSPEPLLRLTGVCKSFGSVAALSQVDFDLRSGEVHALLGENGAGKSTLIKTMTGACALDAGDIRVDGQSVQPDSPAAAQRLGISAVYQEVNLLPNLSVAHNLYLGREPRRFGGIRWSQVYADSRRLLQRFNLNIDVRQSLSSFSVAVQQLVAIARGVDLSARVLILDEPTASLDAREVSLLFDIVEELRRSGIGIIFVTHFLDQVYAISDRITVLRNGRSVGTFATDALPRSDLILHMLGRDLQSVEQEARQSTPARDRALALQVNELAADNGLRSASFSAGTGEALGLSGLLGSGRTEVCEALFGLANQTGGSIRVFDQARRISSPGQAASLGLALCPEDRKSFGVVGSLTVRENIVLALQARTGWLRRLAMNTQQQLARQAIERLGIVCQDIETEAGNLSGGNQQKLILARWLSANPRVLILDEPTRGIDVGAHAEIINLIRHLRDEGLTVIVASSEIEELIAFSDRILVLHSGATVAELGGDEISETAIVAAIAQST